MTFHVVAGLWALWVNFRFLVELSANGVKRRCLSDVISRTALFNIVIPIGIVGQSAGLMISMEDATYWVRVREPLQAAFFVAFIATTSSVSSVWLEMAKSTVALGQQESSICGRPSSCGCSYEAGGMWAAAFAGACIMLTSRLTQAPGAVALVGTFFTIGVAVSYHIGGQRVENLLSLVRGAASADGGEQTDLQIRTEAIAAKIRSTSKFMSRAICVLAISLFVVAATIPSQAPLYPMQNELPPWLCGQIPLGIFQSAALAINLHIIDYLRFWKRGASRREVSGAAPTDGTAAGGAGQRSSHKSSSAPPDPLSAIEEERSSWLSSAGRPASSEGNTEYFEDARRELELQSIAELRGEHDGEDYLSAVLEEFLKPVSQERNSGASSKGKAGGDVPQASI